MTSRNIMELISGYAHRGGIANSVYSVYKYTMVLYLALNYNMKTH